MTSLNASAVLFVAGAGELQARVASGTHENRNGIVYSAIRNVSDAQCLVRVIGRVLRNVFMLLADHGYVPLDCSLHTVSLHMQLHWAEDIGP